MKVRKQCFRAETLMKQKNPEFFLNAKLFYASPEAHRVLDANGFIKRESGCFYLYGVRYFVNEFVSKDLVEVIFREPDE